MNNRKFSLLFHLFAFSAVNFLSAQNLTGDWFGILDFQGIKLEIDLRVQAEGNTYSANLVVPDQSLDVLIPEFSVKSEKLAFHLPKLGIRYEGVIDAGFKTITGTFSQGGESSPLNFSRLKPEAPPGSQDWVKARFTKQEIYIPMRDGVRLFTSIYVPKDSSRKYPMLLTRTPYNVEPNGETGTNFGFIFMTHLLQDGYIVVLQDVFYSTIGRPRPTPTRVWPTAFEWPNQDNYRFFLELGALKNVKTRYFGDTIQFWSDLMSHPNYDAFWKARDPRTHLKNLQPAVLTVGGWFDAEDCYGALRTYEAIEKQNPATMSNRLIIGPWFHGQWTSGDADKMGNIHWGFNTAEHYMDVERRFFRHYLHGEGALDLPEADIFVTGSNEWRSFNTWPPRNVSRQNLYFQQAGGLSFSAPTVKADYDEYVADPMKPVPYTEDIHRQRTRAYMTDDQRFAARRPDVMVYQTEPMVEEVTLTGPLTANLFVSTSGTDADYIVKLIDVFPDTLRNYPDNENKVPMAGYQMLVRGEVMRGRFRESFESPQPFKPGEVTEVKFDIPDVAHTFKRGHRMMIQVQNSWFPLVDRNPQKFVDIYQCSEADFQKATHRVYHDAKRPSNVQVWKLENK